MMPSLTSVHVFDDSVPDFTARGLRQWQGRYSGKPQPKIPTWLSELHALGNYQLGILNLQHRYSKRVVHKVSHDVDRTAPAEFRRDVSDTREQMVHEQSISRRTGEKVCMGAVREKYVRTFSNIL